MTEIDEVAPARQLGILKNPRWEAFAHAIARGRTADAAYQEAGYAQSRGNASRLRSVEIVDRRVGELKKLVENIQKLSTHKTVLTQAFVIENLIGIVADARALNDFAGANKALHLLGLELGLFVEKKEVGKPGEFDGLSIAGKRERMIAVLEQLGLSHLGEGIGLRRFGDAVNGGVSSSASEISWPAISKPDKDDDGDQ
jgi:phage terminase small subunit